MKLCNFEVGLNKPFFLIAGPCVIESEQMAFDTAGQLKEICESLGIAFIYKSSYDKFHWWLKWWMCCKPRRFYAAKPILFMPWPAQANR